MKQQIQQEVLALDLRAYRRHKAHDLQLAVANAQQLINKINENVCAVSPLLTIKAMTNSISVSPNVSPVPQRHFPDLKK